MNSNKKLRNIALMLNFMKMLTDLSNKSIIIIFNNNNNNNNNKL